MKQQIVQKQTVDYFGSAMPSMEGLGEYFANATPIQIAANQIKKSKSMTMNGVGQIEIGDTGKVALGLVILVVAGALSYQAGKAMAPSKQDETTWGWVGVPMGIFLPFGIGLGIMGVVSNSKS